MRTYETPIGKLPSVTTILRLTEDEKAKDRLRKWQQKQDKIHGVEQANNNSKDRLNRGKEIHEAIMHKFQNGVEPAETWVHEGNEQRWKHLQPFLKSITIMECEREVWHPSGYAGTADLIAIMDNHPTLLDWKTSERVKKRQWMDEAFIQTAAYAKAWNFSELPQDSPPYLNDITQLAVIVISPEKLQIFTEDNVKKYEELWDERLTEFQRLGIIVE